jgi:hypothetical protein
MLGAIPPLSQMPSWRSTYLKHRENFVYLIGCMAGETTNKLKELF